MMKLSEKGIAKVNESMVVVRDYSSVGVPIQVIRGANRIEFEADDFENVIVLTVNEAKEVIADYIDVVAEVVRQRNKHEIKIKHPKSILTLMEQIGKTEKKDAND